MLSITGDPVSLLSAVPPWREPFCVFSALEMTTGSSPVPINEAGVNVGRSFHAPDGLETHTVGLKGHDVHQAVFKPVTLQVGTDEPRGMRFGAGKFLHRSVDTSDITQ